MIPLTAKVLDSSEETVFVVRWYLRLSSVFNPAFFPREKTEGVGYFMTERGKYPKIIRHALTQFSSTSEQGAIKYFLKNIPEEHKESFRAAFEAWNQKFIEISGRPLFRYEFIDADDSRSPHLVTGDVRYNILEWDLENEATYGGLGPSIANQFTGEILSSNVLIQGPRIVEIYKKWFQVSEQVQKLKAQGLETEAQFELRTFLKAHPLNLHGNSSKKLKLVLGDQNQKVVFSHMLEKNIRSLFGLRDSL